MPSRQPAARASRAAKARSADSSGKRAIQAKLRSELRRRAAAVAALYVGA